MNEELILKMVDPFVKDGTLTYTCFDELFSMLSRKEQYAVCELLYINSILLVDDNQNSTVPSEGSESILEVDEFPDEQTGLIIPEKEEISGAFDALKDPGFASKDLLFLSPGEIKTNNETLVHLIQQGNQQAKQDLCIKNEKLVIKCANRYLGYFGNDLDIDDLTQAGFIGLLSAAEKYNSTLDVAFSTYAIYWIKQAISREIMDKGFSIRIPVHVMEKVAKVTSLDKSFAQIGMTYSERISAISDKLSIPEDKIEDLLVIRDQFLSNTSLDTPVGEEEELPLGAFIPADESLNPVEDQCLSSALYESLNLAIDTLKPREAKVIRLRFGFEDGHPHTLEYVGKQFNVTRERIRQIEAKALRKLKHPSRQKLYMGF